MRDKVYIYNQKTGARFEMTGDVWFIRINADDDNDFRDRLAFGADMLDAAEEVTSAYEPAKIEEGYIGQTIFDALDYVGVATA